MERGIRKCLTSVIRQTSYKIFGKLISQALVISIRLKFTQDDRTDTNVTAPLRMLFQRSKSTLDSLKSVFNICRRKPSLRAPVNGTTKSTKFSTGRKFVQCLVNESLEPKQKYPLPTINMFPLDFQQFQALNPL